MNMKKIIAAGMAAGLLMTAAPVFAEETAQTEPVVQETGADAQKLDTCYTLALNAINAEDYAAAKEYLHICFAYCDPQANPAMYADLLLKQACIDVIEERNDLALLNLDAALRIQPDLADAYLVRTQAYASQGEMDAAIENLEKYIELTEDSSLYETVALLHEANGNMAAAQDAYDKFAAAAGEGNQEAGFQAGLYRMENGKYEEAIEAFEAYAEDETFGAGAQYNIGVCKMNLGDYAGAIAAFTACEEKGGTFDGLYYNRGVCLLMEEEWEKAAADFARSVEAESFKDDARFDLGICRMQLEDYEAAVQSFTELIDEVQQETEAAGETGEAARILNDAVYYYRGVCNGALGNLEASLADYTVCIEHGYELAQSYYQRAQVYAALGDAEKQAEDLKMSLK